MTPEEWDANRFEVDVVCPTCKRGFSLSGTKRPDYEVTVEVEHRGDSGDPYADHRIVPKATMRKVAR